MKGNCSVKISEYNYGRALLNGMSEKQQFVSLQIGKSNKNAKHRG